MSCLHLLSATMAELITTETVWLQSLNIHSEALKKKLLSPGIEHGAGHLLCAVGKVE